MTLLYCWLLMPCFSPSSALGAGPSSGVCPPQPDGSPRDDVPPLSLLPRPEDAICSLCEVGTPVNCFHAGLKIAFTATMRN